MVSSWAIAACTRPSTSNSSPVSQASIPSPVATVTPPSATITQALQSTPRCDDGDEITPSQTAGPFYTPNSPERTSLIEPGVAARKLLLTGWVLLEDCIPVAGALVDFWHTDETGQYDNAGYRYRGHQFTDVSGRYFLETIVPGKYPSRTRHIHVKVQAANQPVLTTQLYFPNEPRNQRDFLFNPKLLVTLQESAEEQQATFNFVLAT